MSEPTKTFADFGVAPDICDSLAAVGITSPFPIQELTLPLALSGADIIGQARTGTGKTLGFGLPLLQRIDVSQGLQALVIVPTRELCLQVAEDLAQAGKGKGVKVVALYGGKAMQPQIDALEGGAHLVVGTPGRLLDLSRRGFLHLGSAKGLVLDEADEMLDLGFLPDVEQLVEQCSDDRQTLLFSATMPAAIVSLARRYMTKPTFMRADVEQVNIAPQTKQYFFSCHRMDKPAVLARILQTPNRGLCVVFCRTKRMADILAEELRDRDVPAQAIHSDLRQEARERALQKFREGKTTVLCATEVAARGLDIDDVSHVVNYDCPDDEKMYLHRIGRTGRAGADGVAITFAVWSEIPRLDMIRRELDIEEEVHEVFSTSPLLDELFDLPRREERKKVPSKPEARSASESRSRRRKEKAEEQQAEGSEAKGSGAKGDRAPRRTRTPDREPAKAGAAGTPGRRAPAASTPADGDADEAAPRKRTRRRSRDGGTTDGASTPRADAPAAAGADDDAEPTTTRRRRTRTTAESAAPGSFERRGRAADDADDAADAGAPTATRTRPRGERTRTEDTAERPKGRDDRGRNGSRGGDRDGGGSRSNGRDEERAGGRDRGGRSRSGRDRGGRDSGGRGSGGRNREEGGRDDRGRDDRGRSERSRRTPAVDAGEARGEGQPRLSRKLDVVHLP